MDYASLTDRTWPLARRLMNGHVAAYRMTGGLIGHRGPRFAPCLLLDHIGGKSGRLGTSPLIYGVDGENLILVASKGGYPKHPAWYHNLIANPDTTLQIRSQRKAVRARRHGQRARATLGADGGRVPRLRNLPPAHRTGDTTRRARATLANATASKHSRVASERARLLPRTRSLCAQRGERHGSDRDPRASIATFGSVDQACASTEPIRAPSCPPDVLAATRSVCKD